MKTFQILCGIVLSVAALLVGGTPSEVSANMQMSPPLLFDDFSYTDRQQMKQNGWIIRGVVGTKRVDDEGRQSG
jgi:hypothetical protein